MYSLLRLWRLANSLKFELFDRDILDRTTSLIRLFSLKIPRNIFLFSLRFSNIHKARKIHLAWNKAMYRKNWFGLRNGQHNCNLNESSKVHIMLLINRSIARTLKQNFIVLSFHLQNCMRCCVSLVYIYIEVHRPFPVAIHYIHRHHNTINTLNQTHPHKLRNIWKKKEVCDPFSWWVEFFLPHHSFF